MTHNHDHSHAHSHDHGNDHSHSHELTFEQKLETLLGHWVDHNDSHKDTFFIWARRAKDQGVNKAALDLEKAGQLSEQITQHLKDALKKLKSSIE